VFWGLDKMFVRKEFISHSGIQLQWKIEADALTDEDLATLSWVVTQQLCFGSVVGIPMGGLRFAEALKPYAAKGSRLLVDDVLTTGNSMKTAYREGDIGLVIFARGPCPAWVKPIFTLSLATDAVSHFWGRNRNRDGPLE
jgi:hypothetical protein